MTVAPRLRAARIQVPASTSNLGAGFDCLGVALGRHLAATYDPEGGPQDGHLHVDRRGTLHALIGRPERDDLFVQAFEQGLATHGATLRGGTLTLDSEIPLARGLGSSAAAVIGGLALAAAVTGSPLVPAAAFAAALRWESHLDNVSAALMGGLVAVTHDEAGAPKALRLPLSSDIGFAYAAPGVGLETGPRPGRTAADHRVRGCGAQRRRDGRAHGRPRDRRPGARRARTVGPPPRAVPASADPRCDRRTRRGTPRGRLGGDDLGRGVWADRADAAGPRARGRRGDGAGVPRCRGARGRRVLRRRPGSRGSREPSRRWRHERSGRGASSRATGAICRRRRARRRSHSAKATPRCSPSRAWRRGSVSRSCTSSSRG